MRVGPIGVVDVSVQSTKTMLVKTYRNAKLYYDIDILGRKRTVATHPDKFGLDRYCTNVSDRPYGMYAHALYICWWSHLRNKEA